MIMPAWLMNALYGILSLLLVFTSSGSLEAYDPPSPPAIPDAPDSLVQELTVISFNVWAPGRDSFGQRLPGVVQTILDAMPDSFGLQEAEDIWRGHLKRELKDKYAIACDVGRMFGIQEGTPIFYLKEKYRLVDQGVFWLSDRPRIPSRAWGANLPRIAGWAVLEDKATGFRYVHFNAHFDHESALARSNSARLIADRINEKGLPAVLTGDLNCAPGSTPAQYLEAGGLLDLRKAAGEADQGGTFHAYAGRNSILDYVYANHYLRGAETARFWVIRDEYEGMYPSDHFAVAARLTLAN